MALITYTLIPSSNKKNKGAKYPRFRINLQNGSKPFFKPFKDVLIYKRADTPEKKKITSNGKRMLQEIKNISTMSKLNHFSIWAFGMVQVILLAV